MEIRTGATNQSYIITHNVYLQTHFVILPDQILTFYLITTILVVVEFRSNSTHPDYSLHPLYWGKSEVKMVRRGSVLETLNLEREIPTEHGELSR